jgi:hypothetical protein
MAVVERKNDSWINPEGFPVFNFSHPRTLGFSAGFLDGFQKGLEINRGRLRYRVIP